MEPHLKSALGITDRYLKSVTNREQIINHIGVVCMLAKSSKDPKFTEEIIEVIKNWLLEPPTEEFLRANNFI